MRLLVPALLAASVSFTAFAPAQACISACGGGGSSTSTPSTSSTDTSSSPSESGDSGNHGVPGAGQSATDVFIEQNTWSASDTPTLASALDRLKVHREAIEDFTVASRAAVREEGVVTDFDGDITRANGQSWWDYIVGLATGESFHVTQAQNIESYILDTWGQAGRNAIANI